MSILDTPIEWDEVGGKTTLRSAFKLLLGTLFEEADGFSGKSPLGNSDWQYTLGIALIRAGLLDGDADDPDENYFEWEDFENLISQAIIEL